MSDDDSEATLRAWLAHYVADRAAGRLPTQDVAPTHDGPQFGDWQPPIDDDERIPGDYELRSALFTFLKRQHDEDEAFFWTFVDGLLIARLPTAELKLLLTHALAKAEADEAQAARAARRGRPVSDRLLPDVDPLVSSRIRWQYRQLSRLFRLFAKTRHTYHTTKRHKRSAARAIRDDVRASPLGQRLVAAGCFRVDFDRDFDREQLTPTEMAALLIHREARRGYLAREKSCRATAATTLSEQTRERSLRWAAQAREHRRQLGSWQTLHDRLKRSTSRRRPPLPQDR